MIQTIASLAIFSVCVWSCICSRRTYMQRRVLWGRLSQFDVSFDAHYWRLLTFRDPWKLYPSDVQKEVRQ